MKIATFNLLACFTRARTCSSLLQYLFLVAGLVAPSFVSAKEFTLVTKKDLYKNLNEIDKKYGRTLNQEHRLNAYLRKKIVGLNSRIVRSQNLRWDVSNYSHNKKNFDFWQPCQFQNCFEDKQKLFSPVKSRLVTEISRNSSSIIKNELKVFTEFKVDIRTLFTKKIQIDPIKYELVIDKIEDSNKKINVASINHISPESLSRPDISWKIEPISQKIVKKKAKNLKPKKSKYMKHFVDSRINFKFSASPKFSDSSLEDMKLSVGQKSGFYSIEYPITDSKLLTHNFKVPLVGASYSRNKFDKQFKIDKTSLENIKFAKKSPALGLHYSPKIERYDATLRFARKTSYFGLTTSLVKGTDLPTMRIDLRTHFN